MCDIYNAQEVDITDGVRPCCLPNKNEDVQPGLEEEYRGIVRAITMNVNAQ